MHRTHRNRKSPNAAQGLRSWESRSLPPVPQRSARAGRAPRPRVPHGVSAFTASPAPGGGGAALCRGSQARTDPEPRRGRPEKQCQPHTELPPILHPPNFVLSQPSSFTKCGNWRRDLHTEPAEPGGVSLAPSTRPRRPTLLQRPPPRLTGPSSSPPHPETVGPQTSPHPSCQAESLTFSLYARRSWILLNHTSQDILWRLFAWVSVLLAF